MSLGLTPEQERRRAGMMERLAYLPPEFYQRIMELRKNSGDY